MQKKYSSLSLYYICLSAVRNHTQLVSALSGTILSLSPRCPGQRSALSQRSYSTVHTVHSRVKENILQCDDTVVLNILK